MKEVVMWICVLIVPAIMILMGRFLAKNPPGDTNGMLGYRSKRSMRSKETWDFAQRYMGRTWIKAGLVMLVATVVVFALVRVNRPAFMLGITFTQIAVLLLSNLFTERALKAKFGN